MKLNNLNRLVSKGVIALLGVCLLMVFPVWGQTGGDFDLSWSTIDGGGGTIRGGDFTLRATIGQPEAGVMAGGDFTLSGGFWPGEPICIVEFQHFARFAEYWLETGTDLPADLYGDGIVDLLDLEKFVEEWLYYCPIGWPLK